MATLPGHLELDVPGTERVGHYSLHCADSSPQCLQAALQRTPWVKSQVGPLREVQESRAD